MGDEKKITLRPYQQDLIDKVRSALSRNSKKSEKDSRYRHIIMQLPTSGGKTICFSYLAQKTHEKGNSVLICSDRSEITEQNGGVLEKFGLKPAYIVPKQKKIPNSTVAVGMLQTIQRRLKNKEWKEYINSFSLVIIDEAHTQSGNALISALATNQFLLGVTATPIRSSGQRQLGEDYCEIVEGVSVSELIGMGFITPCDHYSIAAPDLSSVSYDNKRGDFNHAQMSKVFEHKTKYEGVVKEWFRLTPNTSTIVFCASSEQAINITKEFVERGVKAKYLLSNSYDEDSTYSGVRSAVIDELASGELTVLVNVGIAIAGLDVPRLRTVITAYATTSLSKYLQSLGRGGRKFEGKQKFSHLDFGGNVSRLGFYAQKRTWGLWYESSRSGSNVAPVKNCPEDKTDTKGNKGCGALILLTAKVCPFCGYYFANEREVYEAHLELVKESDEVGELEKWVAQKVDDKWSNQRILMSVCMKNIDKAKSAFFETIPYLRKKDGSPISKGYWYTFEKEVLSKYRKNKKNVVNL